MCVHSPESHCEARGIRQSMSSSTSLHVKYCQQGTEAVFMHFKNKKRRRKRKRGKSRGSRRRREEFKKREDLGRLVEKKEEEDVKI